MAAIPTIIPSFINGDYTTIKTEKFSDVDDECEITRWLKLETEAIPALPLPNGTSHTIFTNPTPFSFPLGCTSENSPVYGSSNQMFPFTTNPPLLPQLPSFAQPNVFPTFSPTPIPMNGMPPMNTMYPMPPQQISTSQFYHQIFAQLVRHQNAPDELETGDKKKRNQRPFVRRVRQTRPKVVEAKGAVQCQGRNRKKGIQCRNAALMEYIGPRPIYCAEHIELDPKSLYEKCKSPYQKEPGDGKGCKEVVLKEFGHCYKHFGDYINDFYRKGEIHAIHGLLDRVIELLQQLEKEAAAAKKKDGDLYQRKNKLIPKFLEMKRVVSKAIEDINAHHSPLSLRSDMTEPLPAIELNASELAPLNIEHSDFKPLVESLSVSDPHAFSLFQAEKLIDSLC